VLTCAAGNNFRSRPQYPAAYPTCIAVGATDHTDAKAIFSNYGSNWVDVAAPGKAILSTAPNHPNTIWGSATVANPYALLDGTSTATPHVAGVAGLVWATGMCSTNTCVRSRIEQHADAVAGTGSWWRWGRLNAVRALTGVAP
jgi:thermitase